MAVVDISNVFQMSNPGDHIDGTDVYQSNRNLLDNPWFTVRQRGNGPFTGNGVTGIDRWKTTNANSTVKGNDGYITLTAASGGNGFIRQIFPEALYGTYTYSAYIRGSGAGYVSVNNSDFSVISSKTFSNPGNDWVLITGTFTTSGNGAECFSIRCNAGTSVDIKCAKLELGSVSTLANDAPPNYAEELAKCQRYFFRVNGGYHPFGVGDAVSATQVRIFVPTPVTMRTEGTHTVTTNGYITIRGSGMTGTAPTNVVWNTVDANGVSLAFTVTGATTYEVYLGIFAGAGYIDLSADL